jgi:hypothetical protein
MIFFYFFTLLNVLLKVKTINLTNVLALKTQNLAFHLLTSLINLYNISHFYVNFSGFEMSSEISNVQKKVTNKCKKVS